MVVLAASVCTKGGKPVIARQFIEMSRSRIEGLLASFPKLLHSVKTAPALSATTAYPQYNASSTGGGASSSSQQTYVETEAVRYIYQPLDDLYLVLVTTKHSNILQDIDTLALFARTVVEYVRGVAVRESEVLRNAYELLVAFDEIVGVEGLREGVTVAAVRAVTEMDSHEERLQEIMQKNKEREAIEAAKLKAKQLDVQRREQAKKQAMQTLRGQTMGGASYQGLTGGYGGPGMGAIGGTYGSAGGAPRAGGAPAPSFGGTPSLGARPDAATGVASAPKRGMQLGGKTKSNDIFAAIGNQEGVVVPESLSSAAPIIQPISPTSPLAQQHAAGLPTAAASAASTLPVHIVVDEKLSASLNRDGGLESMEVKGELMLRVSDAEKARLFIDLQPVTDSNVQFKTHPHVDKNAWASNFTIGTREPMTKPFPVGAATSVLKWRYATKDESMVPLAVNVWPTPGADGSIECSVEYELIAEKFELRDVVISIPVPPNAPPRIENVDGEYTITPRSLDWRIPVIDAASSSSGTLEFSLPKSAGDDVGVLFPVRVSFASKRPFCDVQVRGVRAADGSDTAVTFSQEVSLATESFLIV